MLPSEAQRLATALELTVAIVLLCLTRVLQCNGEPVVTCLVAIACELVLDSLNELRQLLMNVGIRLALAPIRGDQIASHDVFKRVVIVEWHGSVMRANDASSATAATRRGDCN